MQTITLCVVLILELTGAWGKLPTKYHTQLVASATGTTPTSHTAPAPAQAVLDLPSLPVPATSESAPLQLGAESAIAIDRATSTILYAKNQTTKRPIASVTKLVTAMVILGDHKPEEIVTIPTLPVYPSDAEIIGLVPGDKTTIGNLVAALLVPSANDAADALAIIDAGSIPKFAAKMNLKMGKWGITHTRFNNPSGLTDDGNYTTAISLAKIAALALTQPVIKQTITYTDIAFTTSQGRHYNLTTTNKLLAGGRFYGIKTGYTGAAGECFVGLTRINGHEVITVVLGSDDRFGASVALSNWIQRSWQWL